MSVLNNTTDAEQEAKESARMQLCWPLGSNDGCEGPSIDDLMENNEKKSSYQEQSVHQEW